MSFRNKADSKTKTKLRAKVQDITFKQNESSKKCK